MTGCKIGYRGTVQCEWRAKKGRASLAGRRKVPQPHRRQLQRHAILRRPLRFASACLRLWFNCEFCELPRRGRGDLARGFGNERRPQESCVCELRTVQCVHRHKLKSDWNLRIALDQKSGALSAAFQAEPARSVVERCRKKSG